LNNTKVSQTQIRHQQKNRLKLGSGGFKMSESSIIIEFMAFLPAHYLSIIVQ